MRYYVTIIRSYLIIVKLKTVSYGHKKLSHSYSHNYEILMKKLSSIFILYFQLSEINFLTNMYMSHRNYTVVCFVITN